LSPRASPGAGSDPKTTSDNGPFRPYGHGWAPKEATPPAMAAIKSPQQQSRGSELLRTAVGRRTGTPDQSCDSSRSERLLRITGSEDQCRRKESRTRLERERSVNGKGPKERDKRCFCVGDSATKYDPAAHPRCPRRRRRPSGHRGAPRGAAGAWASVGLKTLPASAAPSRPSFNLFSPARNHAASTSYMNPTSTAPGHLGCLLSSVGSSVPFVRARSRVQTS